MSPHRQDRYVNRARLLARGWKHCDRPGCLTLVSPWEASREPRGVLCPRHAVDAYDSEFRAILDPGPLPLPGELEP